MRDLLHGYSREVYKSRREAERKASLFNCITLL